MATTSPILGLGLPAEDGSDQFSLSQFLTNWGILDDAPGVFICTSETHPSWGSNQNGRLILETDTGDLLRWNGSDFVDTNLNVFNLTVTGTLTASGNVDFSAATITENIPMNSHTLTGLPDGSGAEPVTYTQMTTVLELYAALTGATFTGAVTVDETNVVVGNSGGTTVKGRLAMKSNGELNWTYNVDPNNSDAIDDTSYGQWKLATEGGQDYNAWTLQYSPPGDTYSDSTLFKFNSDGTLTVGAYSLPATDGTADEVLTTNGSGVVSWGPGGSTAILSLNIGGTYADVPCWGVPTGYTGSGTATVGAQLTIGTNVPSGFLEDAQSNPLPDGWTFPAFLFVEGSMVYDIISFNAFTIDEYQGGLVNWTYGGFPSPLPIPGGIRTPGPVYLDGLPTSDPASAGQLWNNSGVLTVSAG